MAKTVFNLPRSLPLKEDQVKKLLLLVAICAGGYYYYLKSNLYTHDVTIKTVLSKQTEICSHQGMLKHQNITSEQCNSRFSASIDRCVSDLKSQYPGDKFNSEEEANAAGSRLANCLTGRT